jgi:flavin-dependent dehydrogenase
MFDVAVIGGGLAGAAAAIPLAQQGWRVVMFEAGNYPRHRVCGEFLSPECVDAMERLGILGSIRALRPAYITQALVTTPSGAKWSRPLPGAAVGVSRYALDAILADRAKSVGADLRTNSPAQDIDGDLDKGFTVHARGHDPVQVRVVIGAHGKRSRVDKALDRPFIQRTEPFIGLKMHYDGPSLQDRVELHAFDGGYCGLSDVEDGASNLCLLSRAEPLQRAGSIPAFVEWMGDQNPTLGTWLRDATPRLDSWQSIAQVSFARKAPVERDVLMTGDAAGLISPLAGDGMGMAFDGGLLAADHVHRYLNGSQSPDSLRTAYRKAWEKQFRRRLNVGVGLQAFLLRPAWLGVGIHLLNLIPPLGDLFISQTRSLQEQTP